MRSGSRTKPASARRTSSPAAGQGAGPDRPRPRTSAPSRPTCSAPSVRRREPPPAWSCPIATPRQRNAHLAEISARVEPGHHAILLLDQAWWHTSQALETPPDITLLPLPAKAPELNPVENLWQFLRDNHLSSRIFRDYTDIVDHCCAAWNTIADQPWRIMSIGLRDWAQEY